MNSHFFETRADQLCALRQRLLTLNSDLSLTAEAFRVNMNEVRQNLGIPNEAVPVYAHQPPGYNEQGSQPTAVAETVRQLRSSVHGSVESGINRSQSL